MEKILFQDLTELMREHGEVNEKEFEFAESEIRRDDWTTNAGGYARLNNSQYQVAFFSDIDNGKIFFDVDKIIGKTQFSIKTYAENTAFGKVARRIVAENGLYLIEETGTYRVGKSYRGEYRAMNDHDEPRKIKDKDELKTTLETVIQTQSRIAKLETNFEEQLYNMSK